MNQINRLFRFPSYITRGIIYKLSGRLLTPKPRVVVFPVNDRCNSRCIMCNRWKKTPEIEITIDKIREVFSSDLFSRVEEVNIHGGEPTLRTDLPEIFRSIQSSCLRLRRMWLSTNGLNPKRIERRIRDILRVVDLDKLNIMAISVSIDGDRETHERIRGVRGGFDQAVETVQVLKKLQEIYPIDINIATVIQPLNLRKIEELEQLAASLSVPIYFAPLMFDEFFNIETINELKFSSEDMELYREVIREKCLKDYSTTSLYWYHLLKQMDGCKRSIPCAFDRYVISLYPTGEILPCSRRDWIVYGNVYDQNVDKIWFGTHAKEIRERMKREVCPTCSNMCQVEYSLQAEFFTYTKHYLKHRLSSLLNNRISRGHF